MTDHFSFRELTNTSHSDLIDVNREEAMYKEDNLFLVAEMLEDIRSLINTPIRVTSGFRFPGLNNRVGGSRTSSHLKGLAADIQTKKYSTEEVFEAILNSDIASIRKCIIEGVGGKNWIHLEAKKCICEETEFYRTTDGKNYIRVK